MFGERIAEGETICPPGFRPAYIPALETIICVPEDLVGTQFVNGDFEPFDPDELGLDPEDDDDFW